MRDKIRAAGRVTLTEHQAKLVMISGACLMFAGIVLSYTAPVAAVFVAWAALVVVLAGAALDPGIRERWGRR